MRSLMRGILAVAPLVRAVPARGPEQGAAAGTEAGELDGQVMCLLHSDVALLGRGRGAHQTPGARPLRGEHVVHLQHRSQAAAGTADAPVSNGSGATPVSNSSAPSATEADSPVTAPGSAGADAGHVAENSTSAAALLDVGGVSKRAHSAGGARRTHARPSRDQRLAAARSAVAASVGRASRVAPSTHRAAPQKRNAKGTAGASLFGTRGLHDLLTVLYYTVLFVVSGTLVALAAVAGFGFSSRKENWWSKPAATDAGLEHAQA